MPLKYGNRVKVAAAAAPALGNFILGSAVSGYQSFASAIPGLTTGDTVRYVIEDGSSWEIGTGTYNTTGPQIARTTVIQSSAGGSTLINASANAIIMLTAAAADFLPSDGGTVTGTVVLPSTTSIGPVSSTEIGYLDGVTSAIQTQLDAKALAANPTFSGTMTLTGAVTEGVFTITGTSVTLNPTNGTIQSWTLSANSTAAVSFASGQSMTLLVDDGTARTITWTGVTFLNGITPVLATTGFTVIELFRVGTVTYGCCAGAG